MIRWVLLFLILWGRLVQLQIVQHKVYDNKLINQHYQHINIKAKRWQILIESPSGEPIQLTTNINTYDIFLDPKFVQDKTKVIRELTPILIDHFCSSTSQWSFSDPLHCLQQLEVFTKKNILPVEPSLFYLGSGIVGTTWLQNIPESATGRDILRAQSSSLISWYYHDKWVYEQQLHTMISGLYYGQVKSLIQDQLTSMIQLWVKPKNFVLEINNDQLKKDLLALKAPFLSIEGNYLYAIPISWSSVSINKAWSILNSILSNYQIIFSYKQIKNLFLPQESRYIKIATNLNQDHINKLKERKIYRNEEKQIKKQEGELNKTNQKLNEINQKIDDVNKQINGTQ